MLLDGNKQARLDAIPKHGTLAGVVYKFSDRVVRDASHFPLGLTFPVEQ